MNTAAIRKIFIIGISSIVIGVASILLWQFSGDPKLSRITEVIWQISFLSLLFFIAQNLRENYRKEVWPVYVFAIYSLLFSFLIFAIYDRDIYSYLALVSLFVKINFILFLWETVYRLFGIVFLAVNIISFAPYYISDMLPDDQTSLLIFLQLLPLLYPAVIMYIVLKESKKTKEVIDSIGAVSLTTHN